MVAFLATKAEYDAAKQNNAKLAIDFTASWCGPCKFIGPKFEALEATYKDQIKFHKVDVDANEEAASEAGVSAMPTFKFFHNGQLVAELDVVGASEEKIKASLDKLLAM